MTREDLTDIISDALGDSMDVDWNYSTGARYVIDALVKEGVLPECKVCRGTRRITVLAGTTHPSYEMDCPVCACRTIAEVADKGRAAIAKATGQ